MAEERFLQLGRSYRHRREPSSHLAEVDGYPNWFFVTDSQVDGKAELRAQRGIWNPAQVVREGLPQVPLLICSSTPWTDVVRPDEGYAIYYGDNKSPLNIDASSVEGNKKMLEAMRLQHSHDIRERMRAAPVLLTTTHGENGSGKGFRRFDGLGVITSAEVILQRPPGARDSFQNIRFEIAILDLKADFDRVSASWLTRRRLDEGSLESDLEAAPSAWREFVTLGMPSIERLRRRVIHGEIAGRSAQVPDAGSVLDDILVRTIDYFDSRKHHFEGIAARVVERVFEDQGLAYRTGWLTQRSGDGGYDFVGSMDFDPIGGFPSSKQVLLGQAKCERSSTNGKDLARLVARLRAGWYGAYVTTAYFTPQVQKEVLVDSYPLLMVPGIRVAASIRDDLEESGQTLEDYLAVTANRFPTRGVGIGEIADVLR